MKKKNITIILILIILFLPVIYFSTNFFIGKDDKLRGIKDLLNPNLKEFVIKYFFPHKIISRQEKVLVKKTKELQLLYKELINIELAFKQSNKDIKTDKVENIELNNGYTLSKYNLINGFYAGINNRFPGSGYIDFHLDNLFVISTRGVLGYTKNYSDQKGIIFNQIKNNINEFISFKSYNDSNWHPVVALRDLTIHKNKIFVSYIDEIKKDCWNTSVISGEINYDEIEFKQVFKSKECVNSKNNKDNEFNVQSAGGRIVHYDDNHIILTVGCYISRYLAQDKNSINGKIIKININTAEYEIVSMGHRNPQGLYFDRDSNFILETEHGPQGGDEINLIEIKDLNSNEIPNYGWAISSYGEHYGGKKESNISKYEKYPLYKSHKEYGFIEPVHAFVPSIGISQIEKIEKNQYVTSSLKDGSLYFFELNSDNQLNNLKRVEVFERTRDIVFKDNKLFLFLEDSASLGIININ